MKRIALWIVIAALVAAFFVLDLPRYLTLDAFKSGQATFALWTQQAPMFTLAAGFLLYVLVAALSLPGAAVMTVAIGALFGWVAGVILVSFASTIGATLAFLASRYLLREAVQNRFGGKLAAINDGVARDGAFYLFTLRLVPVFPFFLINLLMGLTAIPTRTFYWVSQAGMLAGTVVYVNAGTQLARLDSLSGILSPALLASFALLGVFPWIARALGRMLAGRRRYAKWPRPRNFERNLVVIGGGAAGLVTAYIGAATKAKVTLIEGHKMGGDCLNSGCVPSKALIRTAKFVAQTRKASSLGVRAEAHVDFAEVMARVRRVIDAVAPHDSVERYTQLGVEVIEGRATITSPWTVEVNGRTLSTRAIVIAAGARPFVPPIPGLEEVGYYTSDTLWALNTLPRRLVVLGGGPIGCELAQAFARLGSEVTQVEMMPRLMGREDAEVSAAVAQALSADGVRVLTGHQALRCERAGEEKQLIVKHGERETAIPFDALLCAVGRVPRTDGYGLEELGIAPGPRKPIAVDATLQTLYPNIYACGDVAGPYQFTHTAGHQAWYAAVNALFGRFKRFKVDYSVIPWVTFTDPEVARVGLSEDEARQRGIAYEVVRYGLDDLDRAITDEAAHGFVKVLTVPGRDRILGATIVGEHAGELIAEFALAMKHGLGLKKILGTVHAYPTWSESAKYAAGAWRRAHTPERLLAWVERYHTWARA